MIVACEELCHNVGNVRVGIDLKKKLLNIWNNFEGRIILLNYRFKIMKLNSTKQKKRIYKENTDFYEKIVPIKKVSNTIDNIVIQKNLPKPDLIKLDTQGSELDKFLSL